MDEQFWEVVGGHSKGGILVREEGGLDALLYSDRLATGALVRALEVKGTRLQYELVSGAGPPTGWVCTRLQDRDLMVPTSRRPQGATSLGCTAEEARAPGTAATKPESRSHALAEAGTPAEGNTSGPSGDAFVTVRGMDGSEVAKIRAHATDTVLWLKEHIAERCDVPVERQQLLSGNQILDDNSRLSSLGQAPEVQLVRLTVAMPKIKLNVRGAWSLSGVTCALSVDLDTRMWALKQMIAEATGMKPSMLELEGGDVDPILDSDQRLSDLIAGSPAPGTTLSVFIFKKESPERARLREDLISGRISAEQAAAIDPDVFMPAC